MSKLLEIFGRAITVNPADLIWEWLNCFGSNAIRPEYEKDFESILELLSRMELEEANSKLQFYLFENPSCTRGRMAASAICLHKNALTEAMENLNSVYMREPTNTLALYVLGYCYERLGQEQEAIEFYQDALKFKNYLTLPHQRLAAIYLRNARVDKAISQYEQLTKENPDDVSSLVLLGHLYLADGKYQMAVDSFDKAILIHPDNFHCDENDDVDLLMQIGETEQALSRLEWLLEKDNKRADLHLKISDLLLILDRQEDAAAHLVNAIHLEPNCLEARIKYGMCLAHSGYPAGAAKEFAKALEVNDEIIDAYLGLAAAQKLADKTHESYKTLSLAAAIAPNSVLLFSHMTALENQKPYEETAEYGSTCEENPPEAENAIHAGIKKYLKLLTCQPDNADAHYKFGLLMLNNSNLAAAIEQFKKTMTINPTHYRAQGKLAICLNETGHKAKAMKLLICESLPDNDTLNLHYKTALLFADRNRFANTAQQLENLLGKSLARTAAVPNLTVVLQNLGLIDRASAAWECMDSSADDESNT